MPGYTELNVTVSFGRRKTIVMGALTLRVVELGIFSQVPSLSLISGIMVIFLGLPLGGMVKVAPLEILIVVPAGRFITVFSFVTY
jgi:hypothetical protein